jgi:hypothetical protein
VSVASRLGAFAAGLAVIFGGAAVAGSAIDPKPEDSAPAEHASVHADVDADAEATHGGSHAAPAAGAQPSHPVRGLAVADRGLRLVVADSELRRGRSEQLRFRVVDERGDILRDFDVEHTKRMHLVVARRDLRGFQHLHPEQAADGGWQTTLRLDEAGSYRVFADFTRDGEAFTLAGDLRVDGPADLKPLPAPASVAKSDGGYDVRLVAGRARPGREARLRFSITREGRPVHTEPYLGAGGHLVALRDGDLAFLHVHPSEHADDQAEEHDDSVGFEATFPTAGRYRLFLQFKHEGRVQTVAFTQEVESS